MKPNTVLLADDHAVVRAGLRDALNELSQVEVIAEVGDGPSVFEALERLEPDCLLIDVTMPNFEPISAIREIRATYPEMKILVVSAYDDDVYVQGMISAGVNGYHLKDQPLSDLRLAVLRILEGERWISSPLLDKLLSRTDPTSVPTLTSRQREIVLLLQEGCDNQNIANELNISVKTVENHLTRLYRQLNVKSRLEALKYIHDHPTILYQGYDSEGDANIYSFTRDPHARILIVEDNRRYRQQLSRMISKVDPQAEVYEAENTEQAIAIAGQAQPKLVFIDVVLGNENGIACISAVKSRSPKSRVILVSAYPDREFHKSGLEQGAAAFIDKKDINAKSLRHILSDAIA